MDISETYIKMCDCLEIQGQRGLEYSSWNEGDCFAYKDEVDVFSACSYGEGFIDCEIDSGKCIWLPRQEDLQEMLYGDAGVMCCVPMAHDLSRFGKSLSRKIAEKYQFSSMEQLWLAFVMSQLHNKIWDGEGWKC